MHKYTLTWLKMLMRRLLLPPVSDKLFPAFGFGAKLPPDYQVSALTRPVGFPTALQLCSELDMLHFFSCS